MNTIVNTIVNTVTNTAVEPKVPSIHDIMEDLRVPNWLLEEVEFHCGTFLDQCIGIGLLVRLWATPEEIGVLIRKLRGGGETPLEKSLSWWAALPPEVRRGVIRAALMRVDDLMDDLPELRSRVAADPVTAAPLALDWLKRRDDLEAILFLASCTSDARVLEGALQTLDERAAAEHSIWFFLPPFDDERLRAVASADPGAWWGDLAAI